MTRNRTWSCLASWHAKRVWLSSDWTSSLASMEPFLISSSKARNFLSQPDFACSRTVRISWSFLLCNCSCRRDKFLGCYSHALQFFYQEIALKSPKVNNSFMISWPLKEKNDLAERKNNFCGKVLVAGIPELDFIQRAIVFTLIGWVLRTALSWTLYLWREGFHFACVAPL